MKVIKKILLIVPEFPPHHVGGGGFVFESLAKTYSNLGYDVLVISGDHTHRNIFRKIKIQNEGDINILRIPELFTPFSVLNTVMPIPFWYYGKLKSVIVKYSPDLIHIHGYGLFMPAQLAKICSKLKLPYLFTIHGAPVSPRKMKNWIISLAYKYYQRFFGEPLLKGAKGLTAVSEYARDFDVFHDYKEKISIVGNGINTEEYKDPGYDIFLDRGIKQDNKTKILLSLGRIEWWKGYQDIIRLLPDMIKAGHEVFYCIGGRDNGYKDYLVQLSRSLGVEDRIIYLDFLTGDDKMSALYHCDILAIPSIDGETFGMTAIEGIIAKRHILTSFFGGLKETLYGYALGFQLSQWSTAITTEFDGNENVINILDWKEIAAMYLKKIC